MTPDYTHSNNSTSNLYITVIKQNYYNDCSEANVNFSGEAEAELNHTDKVKLFTYSEDSLFIYYKIILNGTH